MDKQTALRKIRKCFALAESDNPDEAARALRQAQALMAEFDIDHPELQASGVSEEWAKSRSVKKPSRYEAALAGRIAELFSCEVAFSRKAVGIKLQGGYRFYGIGSSAEIAAYTFSVLFRQLIKARTTYAAEKLKRYSKNKVAAADLFCEGWVWAVYRNTNPPEVLPAKKLAMKAYSERTFHSVTSIKPRTRDLANQTAAGLHHMHGLIEGRKAQVNPGVGGAAQQEQLSFG